ncbi:MAG: isoleucine--tRNA ligase [Dehalococcoidia bacterium]
MFEPVTSKVSFPELERRMLSFWQEKHIFERSVEQRKGGPQYVLYDGPPTANAGPGIHHVLARVFKDLFPRYKTMKGYYAERKAGWDTHGLPVELEVENELKLKSKPEIEEFGIAEFNSRCRQNVLKYVQEWKELTDRIGFWIDMEHPYITFDNGYIETCWWIIKQLWEKGLIYQGYRVTPHCPRCETSLSSHEVALGYAETDDPSIYVKFKMTDESRKELFEKLSLEDDGVDTFFLAWTTTPWTLPGNTALAVAPDAQYAVVEGAAGRLILAADLVEQTGLESYETVTTLLGTDLAGLHYERLYGIVIAYGQGDRPAFRIIEGDFVSMDEGTGIVHIAPAYGQVDFEVGEKEGLPLVYTVDLSGRVEEHLITGLTPQKRKEMFEASGPVMFMPARPPLVLPGRGKFVKDADYDIIADLKSGGLLYRSETIRHTYPFCWRCNTPLLYYAKPSWYIKTTAVKDRLVSGNEEINWYPEHIKYGRFGDWLNNNVDWAFSRERYWGTPLPIWRCDGCNHEECIGSVEELEGKPGIRGIDGLSDLHRPYVDGVVYDCPKCGREMRRVPEVIDCWFDSGAMPFAQWHYPFENQTLFEERFPADYICEAVDQTRGWFYSLHAISILLKERPCFKNVICLGHILDSTGEKMSKTKGNVVTPGEVLDASGADALRWYLYTSSPPGNVRRFSSQLVEEVVRKFLLTVWNTYSFFVTYANIDKFDPGTTASLEELAELDRWILSELNQLIDGVTHALDQYDPTGAGRMIEDFVQNLSNWYVRRSRRRFWKSENDADKLAAYATLYRCLVTLAKLLAPFTPFVAEEIYQNLVRSFDRSAPESVHLADYPQADLDKVDEELSADTRLVMAVSSMGRSARAKSGLKVRQPLAKILVRVRSKKEEAGLNRMATQVLEELNVKELHVVGNIPVDEAPDWPVVEEGGLVVMIDSDITPELADEGLARELVHRLQMMRKQAGFDIADYIETYYQGGDAIKRAMKEFTSYIKQETLSRTLAEMNPPEGAFIKSHMLEGNEVTLAVKRTSS